MKRVISFFVICVMLVSALAVINVGATEFNAGDKFVSDLAIGKSVSGQFRMAGYKYADGTLAEVEAEEKATWSPDWPGHFVVGADTYVAGRPEQASKGYVFDLMPGIEYGAAVVFKAPAEGSYNIVAKAARLYAVKDGKPNPINIAVMKADGTVLAEKKNLVGDYEEAAFDLSVQLAKDEEVFLVVNFAAETKEERETAKGYGGYNVGFASFEATLVSVGADDNSGAQGGTTTNPETSDNLVFAVSALALAAAGVVIASKKRR